MKDMSNYYERPCRALVKYENGKTRTFRVYYDFEPKKGKLIGLWSNSTGKSLL